MGIIIISEELLYYKTSQMFTNEKLMIVVIKLKTFMPLLIFYGIFIGPLNKKNFEQCYKK